MINMPEIIGKRFGKVIVLREYSKDYGNGRRAVFCEYRCDCGNTKESRRSSVLRGDIISCGCAQTERLSKYRKEHPEQLRKIWEQSITHGMCHTRLYSIWQNMKTRCNNHDVLAYKNYGGRGIKVCDEWEMFEGFYNDMSPNYKDGLTLERKDTSGDYCKDNCIWIPKSEQAKNRRNNRYYLYNGEKVTLAELCKIKNEIYNTIIYRIDKAGKSINEALGTNEEIIPIQN